MSERSKRPDAPMTEPTDLVIIYDGHRLIGLDRVEFQLNGRFNMTVDVKNNRLYIESPSYLSGGIGNDDN